MLDKLNEVEKRFEEINALLCEPDVVSDQEQYTKLMKEMKHLTPVVEKFREYKKAQAEFDECRAMLDEGVADPDFAEMVKEEFEQSKASTERITEELKVLLLPRDPNDDKNVIIEIRGGAGGEESALLQVCFSECIPCMPNQRALKRKLWAQTKRASAAIRKSAFPLRATALTAALNLKAAFTGCSVCRKRKARAEFTPQQSPWLFFPKRKRLILN